ncbi:MAG: rhodanese-like domain-containing protein [bacterium]
MFNFLKSGSATAKLTAADAVVRLAKGEITVIDVREAAEIAASGKAKGALHIPLALIPLKADPKAPDVAKGLDLTRPVAVYCASGMRSGSAVTVLKKLGYDAHNIGTIRDWAAAGGAISR